MKAFNVEKKINLHLHLHRLLLNSTEFSCDADKHLMLNNIV